MGNTGVRLLNHLGTGTLNLSVYGAISFVKVNSVVEKRRGRVDQGILPLGLSQNRT